jgi:hypothetical protein
VLSFAIARDGKSFWVVERTSDISFRLLVRDFTSGATRYYDLGQAEAGKSIEGTHSVVTAVDGQSAMLLPDPESLEERAFFGMHQDRTVRRTPPGGVPLIGAVFVSANEACFALATGSRKSAIVKLAISHEGDGAAVR